MNAGCGLVEGDRERHWHGCYDEKNGTARAIKSVVLLSVVCFSGERGLCLDANMRGKRWYTVGSESRALPDYAEFVDCYHY
jgi:hypothetical protein